MEFNRGFYDDLVTRIRRVSHPASIILFGSRATGNAAADSDVDLLVLFDSPFDRDREWLRIRSALRGTGCSFDLVLMNRKYYEDTREIVGGLAYPASHHGKELYP